MTIGVSDDGADWPSARRRRSVGQAGKKSETTLGIAGFHFKIGAFSSPDPDQLKLPASTADAGDRQGAGGERGYPPASDRGGGLSKIGRFSLPSPAADGDADGAGRFGSKLQAAGGGHGETGQFGNDGP